MEATHKSVQIVRPVEQGKDGYDVDEAEIERIFESPDVANKPVAIYSVAGAFRKGKSFMLNFFLRYLWADKNHLSNTWLQNKEEELNKGFVWRGGSERQTQGIWIWDEPFFVTTPHGEVAVFLLDTQGSFDPNSSMKDCSVIFGFSMLLSSVQIYNLKEQIQEDTLQSLQLFTEYARVAKESQGKSQKPFQSLVFLIRDWANLDFEPGLESGNKVLQDVLQPQLGHNETKSVRKHLRESFQNITCCLMPHPGFAVSERRQNQTSLRINEIRPEFLSTVDMFVRSLFLPENIVIKTVNSKIVTGKDLINFALLYFNAFSSGKMPEVETIFQATAKADILSCHRESLEWYKKNMEEKCGSGYHNEKEVTSSHIAFKIQALESFDQKPKMGESQFITKYRENLDREIEELFDKIQQENQNKLTDIQVKIVNIIEKTAKMFIDLLTQSSGGQYIAELALEVAKQKCLNDALNFFDEKTAELHRECVENNRKKLEEAIHLAVKRFTEENRNKFQQAKQNLDEEIKKIKESFFLCFKESSGDVYVEQERFQEIEQDCYKQAYLKYKTNAENFVGNLEEIYRVKLDKKLSTVIEQFQKKNNKKLVKIQNETKDAFRQYEELIQTKCNDDDVLSNEDFQEAHENAQTQAFEQFHRSNANVSENLKNDEENRLKHLIQKEHERRQNQNERNQKLEQKTKNETLSKAKNVYKTHIKEMCGTNYINEQALEDAHLTSKNQAWASLCSEANETSAENYRSDWNEICANEYQKLQDKNKKLKEKAKENISQTQNKAYKKYNTKIKNVTAHYLNENDLKEENDIQMKKALMFFEEHCTVGPQEDITTAKHELQTKIQERFNALLKENTSRKEEEIDKFEKKKGEVYQNYKREMDQATQKHMEETALQTLHLNKRQNALTEYQTQQPQEPKKDFSGISDELFKEIDLLYKQICQENKKKKDIIMQEAEQMRQHVYQKYLSTMNEMFNGKYANPTNLLDKHNMLKADAEKELLGRFDEDSKQIGMESVKKCHVDMDEKIAKLLKRNDRNKDLYARKQTAYYVDRSWPGGILESTYHGAALGAASGTPGGVAFGALFGLVSGLLGGPRPIHRELP